MKNKKYYKSIDIIRLLSCVFILLYHLNILKGGYLAVCTFFVLSGYLSCISLFSKEKISLKEYYLNKLKKIYLPLLIVVFSTLAVINIMPNILWLNLKPETTSVLLGYNNYWQINANLDYFARHISSPFMHFWYIAILLQFDLIFPFVFIVFKTIGEKTSKLGVIIFQLILSITSAIFFFISSKTSNTMFVYYSTQTRLFSLLMGVALGFVNTYYKPVISKRLKKHPTSIFIIYLLIYTLLAILIKADSKYFAISMIFISIMSCRLIDYATLNSSKKQNTLDKIINYLSSITYEIYLFQYPVIFVLQETSLPNYLKITLTITLTVLLSILLNFSLSRRKEKKEKSSKKKHIVINTIKYAVLFLFIIISLRGSCVFATSKDYTEEMNKLEEELKENTKIMEEKQKEYALKLKQQEDEWNNKLKDLENAESEIENIVINLPIVGVGDSVMLGALNNLYSKFPNGYFDAAISRTDWEANKILVNLKNNNMLGSPIIFNLGANGACPEYCRREIIETSEGRDIYWINVTNDNDVHVNNIFESMEAQYSNIHVIDWNSYSRNHPEYFIADGIHLTEEGKVAYTNCIYEAIYNTYLEKYNKEKEDILKKHEEEKNKQYTFLGNDLLLNIYEEVHNIYSDAEYIIDKNISYKEIYARLNNKIKDNTLSYNIVFLLDKTINLSKNELTEIVKLCNNHNLYFISLEKNVSTQLKGYENVKVYEFYKEIENNKDYLMADQYHLTEKGNKQLISIIKEIGASKDI